MNNHWCMEFNNISGKLIADEPTHENCWGYYFTRGNPATEKGYGVIASTRALCAKKLLKAYNKEIKEQEKELAKLKRFVKKVERELNDE